MTSYTGYAALWARRCHYFVLFILAALVFCGCEVYPDYDWETDDFYQEFLQDNQTNVPVDADLQVLMQDLISSKEEFSALTVTLQEGGTPVDGNTSESVRKDLFLVYDPTDKLMPGTSYVLTVNTNTGQTFVFNFTTEIIIDTTPPQVTIEEITLVSADPVQADTVFSPADGITVQGLVRVKASVIDDISLIGDVTSYLDAWQRGALPSSLSPNPFYFFINTAALADGTTLPDIARTLSVLAEDLGGNTAFGSLSVNVYNGSTAQPAWIFEQGLDPVDGITLSPTLRAAFPPGVVIELYAFTDGNYTSWGNAQLVGKYDSVDNYQPQYTIGLPIPSPGVPCLRIFNLSGAAWILPASTLKLVMPDQSALTVNLPLVTINNMEEVGYYVAADGSAHFFRAAGIPVLFTNPPDLSPSAALGY